MAGSRAGHALRGRRLLRVIAAGAFALAALVCRNADAGSAAGRASDPPAFGVVPVVQRAAADAALQPRSRAAEPGGWIDWNGNNFFGPCRGDCAISLYGGKEVSTSMERIFFVKYPPAPPWKWRWRNSGIIAAAFSRRLVTFWHALSLSPEFGVGQRFGRMNATEFWAAINISWTEFPWNDYVKTTIGLSEGLDLATQVDTAERLLNDPQYVGGRAVYSGSDLLNFFTPEVTLALPEYPRYAMVFRFHHRSGIFGLLNHVHAGAQYMTIGFRIFF